MLANDYRDTMSKVYFGRGSPLRDPGQLGPRAPYRIMGMAPETIYAIHPIAIRKR
jgi:hypothetical protein